MNHLIKFEAYALDKAKELTKHWKENGGEARYDSLFGKGVYRIYLPFTVTQEDKDNFRGESNIQDNVIVSLRIEDYRVEDYYKGTATKIGDTKNVFKIGKLLQRFAPTLKPSFDSDPVRAGYKMLDLPLEICISRHAYDIGGMSTGRGWTSCMNLHDGLNRHYVKSDVIEGTLIAYLIKKSDRNIKTPVARTLIKPFTSSGNTNQLVLIPEEKAYGFHIETFIDGVKKWVAEINKNFKYGKYRLSTNLYNDGIGRNHSIAPDGYSIEDSFLDNEVIIVKNNENEHYKLIDGDGIEITSREYSTLLEVDVNSACKKDKDYENHKSYFFYALEENIKRTKRRSDLLVQIIAKDGRVIIAGDINKDEDYLYGYLKVELNKKTYLIDSIEHITVEADQILNTSKWCCYVTPSKELYLIDKSNHKKYEIKDSLVRRLDLYEIIEIGNMVSIQFESFESLLITFFNDKIEYELVEDIIQSYHTSDKPLIKYNEDTYDTDMYGVELNGKIKKFSLDFKKPDMTNTVTRNGIEDTYISFDDTNSFYSVKDGEFIFNDLKYSRCVLKSNDPLVIIKSGMAHGLINLVTRKVLLNLDKKHSLISTGNIDYNYTSKLAIPKDLSYREVWIVNDGKTTVHYIDENGKFYDTNG